MEPKSLQEAILYFADPVNCREYLVARRWPDGVECPRCGSDNVLFLEKYNRWHCREKHKAPQFTLKTGTVLEDSPIGLDKWLTAMWMLVNCKNGVSSYEIHRDLGVTQKSAWFMLQRLRLALQEKSFFKMSKSGGPVEVDETFIGGKARNMHKSKRLRMRLSTESASLQGGNAKTIVMGLLQRGGRVHARVIPERRRPLMQDIIRDCVEKNAIVMTDEHVSYTGLNEEYVHEVINHAEAYARNYISTNGIENFWSLVKRALNGTYVSVEPFHLFTILTSRMFRYNNRATKDNPLNDSDRFDCAVRQIVGKRLTYSELTRKEGETAVF